MNQNPNPQTLPSLKLTFSHLKMDGWKTSVSFWVSAYFQGWTVSFGEGDSIKRSWLVIISGQFFGQVWERYLQRLTLQHLLATIPHKLSNPITTPTRPWVSYSKNSPFLGWPFGVTKAEPLKWYPKRSTCKPNHPWKYTIYHISTHTPYTLS